MSHMDADLQAKRSRTQCICGFPCNQRQCLQMALGSPWT